MSQRRTTPAKQQRPNIWVVANNAAFAVREEGRRGPLIRGLTQRSAIRIARTISQEYGSELFVQRKVGEIRFRDSHGADPFPPKG